jgi:SAM-dependent methyltransferase
MEAHEPANSVRFTQQSYWDARFTTETEHEWLCAWPALRSLVLPYLRPASRVLVIGNGSSRLPVDLSLEPAVASVLSTDYSLPAVDGARARWAAAAPNVEFCVADMLALEALSWRAPFDAVVDKGALDALLAVGGDCWEPPPALLATSRTVCAGVAALLAPGGVFLQVSFSQPIFRTRHLLQAAAPEAAPVAAPVAVPASPTAPLTAVNDADDEWEPDCRPDVAAQAPRVCTDVTGTPWASIDIIPVDAGLGYFLFALRKR